MKCLIGYKWVKLSRCTLPQGKGLIGYWAKLAARAAFRCGSVYYCGYKNNVRAGMWSGGIVGIKSILGVRTKIAAMEILETLQQFGYISFQIDAKTKKLEYVINDWTEFKSCSADNDGTVYATNEYGFFGLPRTITDRLAARNYIFDESDAWLDLWAHSVYQDPKNAFSYLAPVIQYNSANSSLTLETLGHRWGWEKTKVWRFFRKYTATFHLHRLPGSYGCLIFNKSYPASSEISIPTSEQIQKIIEKMRILSDNAHLSGSDHRKFNKLVLYYSRRFIEISETSDTEDSENTPITRVALSDHIIRVYFSQCWNRKNCDYDCSRSTGYKLINLHRRM